MRKPILTLLSIFVTIAVRAADEGPCKKDIETFCPMVVKGTPLIECLSSHAKELSPGCQERYKDMEARNRHTAKDCREDVERFCSDRVPGGGALIKCLVDNKAKVSKACKATLERKR